MLLLCLNDSTEEVLQTPLTEEDPLPTGMLRASPRVAPEQPEQRTRVSGAPGARVRPDGQTRRRREVNVRVGRRVLVAALVTIGATACGGGERTDAQTVAGAASDMLDLPGYSASVTLTQGDDLYDLEEEVNLRDKERLVRGLDGDQQVEWLHMEDGEAFVRGAPLGRDAEEVLAGRWVRLTEDQFEEESRGMDGQQAILVMGAAHRFLQALEDPDEVTLIGREVLEGEATTHYLAEAEVPGFSERPLSLEVWVADNGGVVQIKTLVQNEEEALSELSIIYNQSVPEPESNRPSSEDQIALEDIGEEIERFEEEEDAEAARQQEEAARLEEEASRRQEEAAAERARLEEEAEERAADRSETGASEMLTLQSRLTSRGIGPVIAGMSVREAEEAAGVDFYFESFDDFEGYCYYGGVDGLDFSMLIEAPGTSPASDPYEGVITSISVYGESTYQLESGLGIGATEEDVFEAYPEAEAEAHTYDEEGQYLTVQDGEFGIRFETDGTLVEQISVGGYQAIQYSEGCA